MQLFYNPNITKEAVRFNFSKTESRHVIKVLRKQIGDILTITNGKGELFSAKLVTANANNCELELIETYYNMPKTFSIHMAVAPTKMNDRFEWFLEKATEFGVQTITPIICEHSERKVIKHERMNKIIQSAMKQSLQTYLPQLNSCVSLKSFLKNNHFEAAYIAHCKDDEKLNLKTVIQAHQNYTILIGPEGDFSPDEITLAIDKGFIPVSLGQTRLRTETAAIAACHIVNLHHE